MHLAKIKTSLNDRDRAVIESLRVIKVATGRQLQRLHFIHSTGRANTRATNRLLERLTRLAVLSRLDRRVGGIHAGSAGYVYSLGVVGLRLLDQARGQTFSR